MALFGHPTCTDECPLLGGKRTSLIQLADPKPTSSASSAMPPSSANFPQTEATWHVGNTVAQNYDWAELRSCVSVFGVQTDG
jgi:hypothetical protein